MKILRAEVLSPISDCAYHISDYSRGVDGVDESVHASRSLSFDLDNRYVLVSRLPYRIRKLHGHRRIKNCL
jgi:hypothetical protein